MKSGNSDSVKDRAQNLYNLPVPDNEPYPFYYPDKYDKEDRVTLIIGDTHVPYHDLVAITSMIKYLMKKKQITDIIFNGDIMDFARISKFEPSLEHRSMKYELDMGKRFLERITTLFKDCNYYFKPGNHEERLEKYLIRGAPELADLEEISLQKILKLDELNIKLVPIKHTIVCANMNIIHGHELAGGGRNPARLKLNRAFNNLIFNHHHVVQSADEVSLNGKMFASYSNGCLCDLHPKYHPVGNKWQHGFIILETFKDSFKAKQYRIINGEVI